MLTATKKPRTAMDARQWFLDLMQYQGIAGKSTTLRFSKGQKIGLHVECWTSNPIIDVLAEMQGAGCWRIQTKTISQQTPLGEYTRKHIMADYIDD